MGQGGLKSADISALGQKRSRSLITAKKPAWFPRFLESGYAFGVPVLKETIQLWECSSVSPSLTCCKLLVARGSS